MFSVSKLQVSPGESSLYTAKFRNLIENYIIFIQSDLSTVTKVLQVHDEYKYKGDFYGLLQRINIPQDLWWIYLRVNGLHSPLDYNGEIITLLMPSRNLIMSLLSRNINTVLKY